MKKIITIVFLVFQSITSGGVIGGQKFDRVVPAFPSKEELLQYKNQFDFIALVKIAGEQNRRTYKVDHILKGSINEQDYNEYIPEVDPLARDGKIFVFFLGKGHRGKVAKLIAIQEDRVEIIGDQKVMFLGYSKEEITNLLQVAKK